MRRNEEHGSSSGAGPAGGELARPRVIVEFDVDGDQMLLGIRNVGPAPASSVRVRFSPSFRGLGGSLVVPSLAVFRRLAFLGPARGIEVLVDSLHSYFARCEPAEPRVIRAVVTFRDGAGRRYRTRIRHDLSIWEDLPRRTSGKAS